MQNLLYKVLILNTSHLLCWGGSDLIDLHMGVFRLICQEKKKKKITRRREILTTNYGGEKNKRCYGGTRTRSAGTAQKV
jgi:hypothetical protein